MPIYEYECQACNHRFEEWQKMSDAPVRVCPKCQAEKVEKLISQTSFQLKGGGWYSDLYSSTGKGSAPSTPTASSPPTPSSPPAPSGGGSGGSTPAGGGGSKKGSGPSSAAA